MRFLLDNVAGRTSIVFGLVIFYTVVELHPISLMETYKHNEVLILYFFSGWIVLPAIGRIGDAMIQEDYDSRGLINHHYPHSVMVIVVTLFAVFNGLVALF